MEEAANCGENGATDEWVPCISYTPRYTFAVQLAILAAGSSIPAGGKHLFTNLLTDRSGIK